MRRGTQQMPNLERQPLAHAAAGIDERCFLGLALHVYGLAFRWLAWLCGLHQCSFGSAADAFLAKVYQQFVVFVVRKVHVQSC